MGYKNGSIDEQEYTRQYVQMMRASYRQHRELWLKLVSVGQPVAVACYCPYKIDDEVKFCHRHLLPSIIEKVCEHHGKDYKFFGELI